MGALLIQEFIATTLTDDDIVFIDPEVIHVYEKVSFEQIDEFMETWHLVFHVLMRLYSENTMN